jgi:hypothetical protein
MMMLGKCGLETRRRDLRKMDQSENYEEVCDVSLLERMRPGVCFYFFLRCREGRSVEASETYNTYTTHLRDLTDNDLLDVIALKE